MESDYNYYQKIKNIPFKILFYVDEYELLTFYNTKHLYRKFINTYNNNKYLNIDFKYNYFPIPVGYQLSYIGNKQVYLIDIKDKLPKRSNFCILKIIGPAEINNNNQLNVINDEEYVLSNFNKNDCKNYYFYFDYKTNISYNKNTKNIYNINKNINLKDQKKYDNIMVNEFSLKKKYFKNNEIDSLIYRKKIIELSLKLLKKKGNLYLEYFNIGNEKTFNIIKELFKNFKSIKFLRSKLYNNTLIGGYYVFECYQSINNKNFNLKQFIDKKQKNIYQKFQKYILKCNSLIKKMKNTDYYKNYQIAVGVEWCKSKNIKISKFYEDHLYKLNNKELIKSIFYEKEGIDYSKIKLYYDTFYSITYNEEGIILVNIIKKYFSNINTIVDANANIGGSTIILAHYFNKIKSIEIETERYLFLLNNIKVFKLKNVETLNMDYNHYKRENNELVFFDPPWGGIFYKIEKKLELYLGSVNIKKYLVKNTIIKVPFNYNLKGIKNKYIIERLRGFNLLIFI